MPRGRAGRAVRAALAVPAALSLGLLAGCVTPETSLREFGIVGTFSEDCARPIEAGGARAIYDVSGPGFPTMTAINRYGTFRSKIVRVDRLGADQLVLYTDDPGGAWNEIDIRKEGSGFVTTRLVSHKPDQYRPLVAIGSERSRYEGAGGARDGDPGDGDRAPGLFIQKCAD